MKTYCTYLTIYSGNKLPPFYIGFSTVDNIKNKNYHGSVSSKDYTDIWNDEIKNNPSAFKTIILTTHVDLKEANDKEIFFLYHLDAKNHPLHINRDNGRIHVYTTHTELTKAKISASVKKNHPSKTREWKTFFGKKHSDKPKKKISETGKGRQFSLETRQLWSKQRQKAIVQFELDGTLIRKWNSIKEAAKKTNSSYTGIVLTCRGDRNKCNNFKWEYIKKTSFV